MENIYGQTEQERNSIVQLPEGFARDAGNTLYSWLGSLWKGLHKGDGMVRGLQAVRGVRLAQMYLNILEAAKLQDRNGAPVFHRELWHPIVVRMSQRDTAQANMLQMGGEDKKIGPQPEGSEYGEGTVFKMGKLANYEEYVTYPVDAEIVGGAVTIVDNIVNPTVFMEQGPDKDFVIRNHSIIFHKSNDPLRDGSPFDRYDIPGFDKSDPGRSDMEAVLWASDVLIDKDYISDHISYVLGADAPSSDVVKRILNAAWSSVTSGLTPELTKTLMAAMLNVPVIQTERETVVDVVSEEDGSTTVHTDAGVYRISPKATLRKEVRSGSVLVRGDLLDESLRIYPFLNPGAWDLVDGIYHVPLRQDIPSVVLPSAIVRANTEFGVYATWNETVVKGSGDELYFDLGGTKEDVAAFWKDVWKDAKASGRSMESILGGAGRPICPAEFLIKNLVGANTLFVVVDRSQIDDTSLMRDPMFFDMLSSVVPSAIRLFLVEHNGVGGDDKTDLGKTSAEDAFLAAALPRAVDNSPEAEEDVFLRFVRPAPAKVRARKEEE